MVFSYIFLLWSELTIPTSTSERVVLSADLIFGSQVQVTATGKPQVQNTMAFLLSVSRAELGNPVKRSVGQE